MLLTHSACRAFHAFTDFLRRNKRTTSVYTWRCLSRLYYLTSHIFTSYKLWGKKKKATSISFYYFTAWLFSKITPAHCLRFLLFFLKFYNLDKIWHRSWRQIYCVALTKWLWQSDKSKNLGLWSFKLYNCKIPKKFGSFTYPMLNIIYFSDKG